MQNDELSELSFEELEILMDYWAESLNVQSQVDASDIVKMGFKETALFTLFNNAYHKIYEAKLVHLERKNNV